MPGWDWTFVGELVFSLAIGIGLGGWAFSRFLAVVMLEMLAHPSVRKLANAAEKFGGQRGGVWGFLSDLVNPQPPPQPPEQRYYR